MTGQDFHKAQIAERRRIEVQQRGRVRIGMNQARRFADPFRRHRREKPFAKTGEMVLQVSGCRQAERFAHA